MGLSREVIHLILILILTIADFNLNRKKEVDMESTIVDPPGTRLEGGWWRAKGGCKRARRIKASASPTQRRPPRRRCLDGLTTSFFSSRGRQRMGEEIGRAHV